MTILHHEYSNKFLLALAVVTLCFLLVSRTAGGDTAPAGFTDSMEMAVITITKKQQSNDV